MCTGGFNGVYVAMVTKGSTAESSIKKGWENCRKCSNKPVILHACNFQCHPPVSMLKTGWRFLEQRQACADAHLTLFYKIHHMQIAFGPRNYLRSTKRRARHSHFDSFISLSTTSASSRLSFYPRTISQRTNLPTPFLPILLFWKTLNSQYDPQCTINMFLTYLNT